MTNQILLADRVAALEAAQARTEKLYALEAKLDGTVGVLRQITGLLKKLTGVEV